MLKQEFPPELDWFADMHVGVDLGDQGMQADYRGDQIDIPTKKPPRVKRIPTRNGALRTRLPIKS
jgi:hypothetical protein